VNGCTAASLSPWVLCALRVSRGLEHECRRRRWSVSRVITWLARRLGVTRSYVRALMIGVSLKRLPPPLVRERLEQLSLERGWPAPVLSVDWVGGNA
jgi:hypothetical protein